MLKELYKDYLINQHYKPILWLKEDVEIRAKIKEEEKYLLSKGYTNSELDNIYETAKKEVLEMLKNI